MEIEMKDATQFRASMDAITNLIDDGELKIGKEGLSLRSIDASGISIIEFSMPKASFSKYLVESEESIGLDFRGISEILSRIKQGESVAIKRKDGRSSIVLEFRREGNKRKYEIMPIAGKKTDDRAVKVNASATIKLKGSELSEALRDAELIGPFLKFVLQKGNADLILKSGDAVKFENEISGRAEAKADVGVSFSLEFLISISKACPPEAEIELSLGTGQALMMKYNIGETKVLYYLAPFIQDD